MIYEIKITHEVINLERVTGSCIINKELKIINFSKFI